MASVNGAMERVKQQLQQRQLLQEVDPLCQELQYHWRKRILCPVLSVQLLLLQALTRSSLQSLIQIADLALSPQALNQAFARLPLQLLILLLQRLAERFAPPPPQQLWKGLRVVMADAMSFLVQDTPQLSGKYHRFSGPRGTLSYPCPKLLALMDHATGLIRKVIILPYDRQELCCFVRMFAMLKPGDVVLLDRAYGSFVHLQMLLERGLHACVRLKRCLVSAPWSSCHYRRIQRLGKQDYLVQWHRPPKRPGWMSRRRWQKIPDSIVLRQIAYRLVRKGFRTHWGWIATTLTDHKLYGADEIIQLYARRWQIEVCFRDLKCTLGLRICTGKSLGQTRKQVLSIVLLYNLIRLAMCDAAAMQKTSPDRLSFKQTLLWILWSGKQQRLRRIDVNRRRRRSTQARRLKNHRRRYQRLSEPRENLLQPPYEAKL